MRSRRRWSLALVLVGLALPACSSAAPSTHAASRLPRGEPLFALTTQPMRAADVDALPVPRVAGARPLGPYDAPAVMYGVWDPTRGTALRAFGLSDRAARLPASPEQSFRIASITKTFTATAVLLLVDDGKVRLDAPVARYVGDLVAPLAGGRTATVRRLLNMTSGFPDYGGRGDGPFATAVLTPSRVWTPAQVVRAAARYAPDTPGAFNYSNTNYAILGELVARVSGSSFGAFVRRRILEPLGLRRTRIPSPTRTPPVQLRGYLDASWASFTPPPPPHVRAGAGAGEDVTAWSTSSAGAAAGGVSTLSDLARWAAADFGTVLLRPRTRAERLRRVPASPLFKGSAYGLGLQIEKGWHWHVGEIFGWESLVLANPRRRQVVVVTRNACCGSAFENYLIAREAMPSLAPVVDPVYRR
ncbi:MAG TPA: serine hydrolase domain-containing protein [Conexibacter sp.]|nr:serine hydrolase domain-containing protein [Conexibacter sp.]